MAYRAFGSNNRQFVENLKKEKVIKNDKIYEAFLNVDRGDFVPKTISKESVYRDEPIHSAPYHLSAVHIYSWALEALELLNNNNNNRGLSFLNVGSGTGYFSYLVAHLIDDGGAGFCDGVEQNKELVDFARSRSFYATSLGRFKNVRFFVGDGYNLSATKNLKYDRIYIGASTKTIEPFVELLSQKGILVCPYNDQFVKIKKCNDESGDFTSQILTNVRFSSLIDPVMPNLHLKFSLNDNEEEKHGEGRQELKPFPKFVDGHGCLVSFRLHIT